MLETDDVVDDGRHGRPLRLGVAVREGDGDLLVGGEHELGPARSPIIYEGVVKSAKGRPRVDGDMLDADGAKEIDDEIGPESSGGAGVRSLSGHPGQRPVGAAAALMKSASVNP